MIITFSTGGMDGSPLSIKRFVCGWYPLVPMDTPEGLTDGSWNKDIHPDYDN